MIEVVSATRLTETEFWAKAPLASSLERMAKDPRIRPRIAFENVLGLPARYNSRIDEENPEEILVFVHDDVWIEDFYFSDRIIEGLRHFDILGLAGNTRRVKGQRRWSSTDDTGRLDLPHLRGAIAHGDGPLGKVGFFGPIVGECELLDGVLLAARKSTLLQNNVRFDEDFDFHFYDLDFCRTARSRGLRLGTWPLSVTHRSAGAFHGNSWQTNAATYVAKWAD